MSDQNYKIKYQGGWDVYYYDRLQDQWHWARTFETFDAAVEWLWSAYGYSVEVFAT